MFRVLNLMSIAFWFVGGYRLGQALPDQALEIILCFIIGHGISMFVARQEYLRLLGEKDASED